MSKSTKKSQADRRKRPRAPGKRAAAAKGASAAPEATRERAPKANPSAHEVCQHCSKDLRNEEKALYVEEEIGRVFCSEACIGGYFGPEVERLEAEYLRNLSASDLTGEEREKYAHFRWITLQEPDEAWREKTIAGDHRYTLISEFQPNSKPVWSICICLSLRGEPSFLYLAFTTRNPAMVDHYRRGERVRWEGQAKRKDSDAPAGESKRQVIDGLADGWSEEETFRAQLVEHPRRKDDVPESDFHLYEACINETLEEPDEVWSMRTQAGGGPRIYHFIRRYAEEDPAFWMIVVARETEEDGEEIEIIEILPTRDAILVQRFRQGEQELGSQSDAEAATRIVH